MFVFVHKKYSRRLINLRLRHCSHLDCFNDVCSSLESSRHNTRVEAGVYNQCNGFR